VGCGCGHFLRTFGAKFPGWELQGLEAEPAYADTVLALPGVTRFHCAPPETLTESYDLIILNHSLEHIPAPGSFLATLRRLLSPCGLLLLDLPHWLDNAFDLVVADHVSHFGLQSLDTLLRRTGFAPLLLSATCIPKELLALARPKEDAAASMPSAHGLGQAAVEQALDWLGRCADTVRRAAAKAPREKFGLFGTAIAGVWAAAVLEGRVDFFLDEDPARSGRTFMGAPVLTPPQVPEDGVVFAAFPEAVAGPSRTLGSPSFTASQTTFV